MVITNIKIPAVKQSYDRLPSKGTEVTKVHSSTSEKMALARLSSIRLFRPIAAVCQMQRGYGSDSGVMGSGAGKGGGTGGTIRDAGGAFGKMEAAHEDQFFRQLQAEQLKALKKHHDDEIEAHEREINRHVESINRLKKRKSEIGSDSSSDSD